MEECVVTEYDTYIEYKFFQKLDTCIKNKKNRERIRTAWENDKALYTDLIKTIEFEFMHYSLHDASHSINILQCIYMLLGRRKIDKLSVGDLWLILETSYSHDIGMATCYNELKEFWTDTEKVEELVTKISYTSDADVIDMYRKIKDHLDSEDIDLKTINILKEHSEWPLEIRKAVTYINSEYIRAQHAKRSQIKIEKMLDEVSRLKIEERLYKIVGKIDYLHGADFKEIFQLLKTQDIGFETDKIHPRFVAQLLRLGDCLDIRNNRFDYGNINYQGGLTGVSNLHYEKHKNVSHFMIDEFKVQIYIDSDDIAVCQNAREWFDIINDQIELLMKHWNSFAPKCIGSLKLSNIDLQVRFKNKMFDYDNMDSDLRANPNKIIELLIGGNLYNTKLISIREYIQNSLDATKIRIADELKRDNVFKQNIKPTRLCDVIPSDIPRKYFENYPIEISIDFCDITNSILEIKITDNGVGMDKEGVRALYNIGTGWKDRDSIKKLLLEMPEWLVPTGGFGIGLLSGFLLTNQINIKTKSIKDSRYNLMIDYATNNIQSTQTVDENYYGPIGTTISMKLPFENFYHAMMQWLMETKSILIDRIKNYNILNNNELLRFAFETMYHFVDSYIVDTVIPIYISTPSLQVRQPIKGNKIYMPNNFLSSKDKENGDNKLQFWSKELNVFVDVNLEETSDSLFKVGYRGIDVDFFKNSNEYNRLYGVCKSCFKSIDLFEKDVKDTLMINRDNFKNNTNFKELLKKILKKYLDFIVKNIGDLENFSEINVLKMHLQKIVLYFYKDKSIINENVLDLLPNDCYIGYPSFLCRFDLIQKMIKMLNEINEIQKDVISIYMGHNTPDSKKQIIKCCEKIDEFNKNRRNIEFIKDFENDHLNQAQEHIKKFCTIAEEITAAKIGKFRESILIEDKEVKNADYDECLGIIRKLFEMKKFDLDLKNNEIIDRTSFIKELLESGYLYCVNGKENLQHLTQDDRVKHKKIVLYDKDGLDEFINEIKNYVEFDNEDSTTNNDVIFIKVNNGKSKDTNSIVDQFKEIYGKVQSSLTDNRSEERKRFSIDVTDFNSEQKEYYKSIILRGLHFNIHMQIINPFCLGQKLGRNEVFLDNIFYDLYMQDSQSNQLSDEQIGNKIAEVYKNSSEFNNLINFVYSMQNQKYTKDVIKNIYLELIKDVAIDCYKDYREEQNGRIKIN